MNSPASLAQTAALSARASKLLSTLSGLFAEAEVLPYPGFTIPATRPSISHANWSSLICAFLVSGKRSVRAAHRPSTRLSRVVRTFALSPALLESLLLMKVRKPVMEEMKLDGYSYTPRRADCRFSIKSIMWLLSIWYTGSGAGSALASWSNSLRMRSSFFLRHGLV